MTVRFTVASRSSRRRRQLECYLFGVEIVFEAAGTCEDDAAERQSMAELVRPYENGATLL
jgi:hypothetical protein